MREQRLGSYELIRRLGEGGMAQVYLARDTRLGREVAVKVLDSRLAERPGFRERFLREARVAAALDHPNIVPLFDFGESGALYLVMPYLSGGSMQERLKHGPLPASEVATFGAQIADALEYAHKRNVVHRDVKPANMLLHADGRVLLADFGLAKILDTTNQPAAPRGRPDAGTPEYMAPEQIQGRTEARSDIYGLGVVLYLLLTGYLPFTGTTSAAVMEGHLYRLPEPPRRRNPRIAPAMESVVLRALAKHPEDRYETAGELGAALLSALVAGDAEPLPFFDTISGPPQSPPLDFSQTSAHSLGGPSVGFGASQATGAPVRTGGRMTARVLPRLDNFGNSQRSPQPAPSAQPSQSSSLGRMSFTSGMHGNAGTLPSFPSASRPAHLTPPLGMIGGSGPAGSFYAPDYAPESAFGYPAATSQQLIPAPEPLQGHGWRLRLVLVALFVLLLLLIGGLLYGMHALPMLGA